MTPARGRWRGGRAELVVLGTVADIDPRPGGHYRVLVGGQHQSVGEYLEVTPYERVVFTFGWDQAGNPITPGSSTVEISLHPEGDKTLVRLTHRGLPADAVDDHIGGWDHYLGRLTTRVEGGEPGPDVIAPSGASRSEVGTE